MSLDGEAFNAAGLKTVLVERLAANPKLIVIIQTAAATPYHDFTAALDLVKQADAAAARDERRKADRLLGQIKQIGKDFDKYRRQEGKGGYTLSGCYLFEIR